jgi:hypothetical protein
VPLSPTETLTAFAMTQQVVLHTYVTSSCGASWGCWGGNTGGLRVCYGTGSSIWADCIAEPNTGVGHFARGLAGVVYAVNGVCHHMANRILSAASIELPFNFPQVRAMRLLYRGGAFGRNLSGQPIYDQWPNRKLMCARSHLAATAVAGSIGPSSPPTSSSTTNFSTGSGLMSNGTAGDESPDPRAELSALIEAGLGHPITDPKKFEGLVEMQAKLHAEQERLSNLVLAGKISQDQYISDLDAAMRDAALVGKDLLGFLQSRRPNG